MCFDFVVAFQAASEENAEDLLRQVNGSNVASDTLRQQLKDLRSQLAEKTASEAALREANAALTADVSRLQNLLREAEVGSELAVAVVDAAGLSRSS